MPSLDAKKFMQLIQYYNLLNKRLKSIIEEKELEEHFFWLIKHYCEIDRLNYAMNPSRRILNDDVDKLINAIEFGGKSVNSFYLDNGSSLTIYNIESFDKNYFLKTHNLDNE